LASLSTVMSLFPEEEPEEPLRADFAMLHLPRWGKRHFNPVTVPVVSRNPRFPGLFGSPKMLKGTAAQCSSALRHGQRPKVWPFVSF
jgi:hypothetical protein